MIVSLTTKVNIKIYYFWYRCVLHFLKTDLKTHKVKKIDGIHVQKSRIFVVGCWGFLKERML